MIILLIFARVPKMSVVRIFRLDWIDYYINMFIILICFLLQTSTKSNVKAAIDML